MLDCLLTQWLVDSYVLTMYRLTMICPSTQWESWKWAKCWFSSSPIRVRKIRYFISIQCGCSWIVLVVYAHTRLIIRLWLEKIFCFAITAHLHLLQFAILPFVHRSGTHKAYFQKQTHFRPIRSTHKPSKIWSPQMHTETTMFTRTLKTYEYAIWNANPLWVVCIALKTSLRKRKTDSAITDMYPKKRKSPNKRCCRLSVSNPSIRFLFGD